VVCIDSPLGRLGLTICYDLRFPDLFQALRLEGADIIMVPSAFTAVTGAAHWEVLLRARAIETQCYLLAANQGGRHANGRETFGHSCLIDPWGSVITDLSSGEGVVLGSMDHQYLHQVRAKMPIVAHRRFPPVGQPRPVNPDRR